MYFKSSFEKKYVIGEKLKFLTAEQKVFLGQFFFERNVSFSQKAICLRMFLSKSEFISKVLFKSNTKQTLNMSIRFGYISNTNVFYFLYLDCQILVLICIRYEYRIGMLKIKRVKYLRLKLSNYSQIGVELENCFHISAWTSQLFLYWGLNFFFQISHWMFSYWGLNLEIILTSEHEL